MAMTSRDEGRTYFLWRTWQSWVAWLTLALTLNHYWGGPWWHYLVVGFIVSAVVPNDLRFVTRR